MLSNNALRNAFITANAISIDDKLYPTFSRKTNDNVEIISTESQETFSFPHSSLDSATFIDGVWRIFCVDRQKEVSIRFYQLTDISQDAVPTPPDRVIVEKQRNISCNADETITYSIKREDWERALENNDNEMTLALDQLQSELKVERLDYECSVSETNAEFDVYVDEA